MTEKQETGAERFCGVFYSCTSAVSYFLKYRLKTYVNPLCEFIMFTTDVVIGCELKQPTATLQFCLLIEIRPKEWKVIVIQRVLTTALWLIIQHDVA